jgi:phospholipid/cholesterol/gamma-HCH transport system substrate-binding protein
MRSRTIREGSVGLLILVGLGLFAGTILWLRGFNPGSRSYKVIMEFGTISGMEAGAAVRYRGVTVGRITSIRPGANRVEVEAEIFSPDLLIPKDSVVQASQSGLLAETAIDIIPQKRLTANVQAKPLDRDCNKDLILCDQSRIPGEMGVGLEQLIQSSVRFADIYSDPQFFRNVNTVIQNSSVALTEITKLSREFGELTKDARRELGTFSGSARELGRTAAQVNDLLATNRATLVGTLDNLNQTSVQLRSTVISLNSVLNRAEQGEFIRNLETLSNNAAQASANLRDLSQSLNSPTNLVVLQQTLDSARATFQNAQKITADLDELTGDPTFRNNLRNLVNGLSGLVSSSQQLYQQAQMAQILTPMAEAANQAAASPSPETPAPADRPANPANLQSPKPQIEPEQP